MNESHYLPSLRPGFNSQLWLADHTLPTRPEPAWQKMAQSPPNDTTQPVDNEAEGQSSTIGTIAENKQKKQKKYLKNLSHELCLNPGSFAPVTNAPTIEPIAYLDRLVKDLNIWRFHSQFVGFLARTSLCNYSPII